MDSRMQTRECSGLHDRGKGVKTAERPIKSHSNGTLRHFHVLSGLSLVAQAAMLLVPRLGKPCKTACKNQNKNSNTLLLRSVQRSLGSAKVREASDLLPGFSVGTVASAPCVALPAKLFPRP